VAGRGGRPLLCTGADLRPPRLLLFSLHADPPLFSVSAVVRPPPAARAGGAGWWRRPEGAGGGDGGARSGSGGGDVGAGSGSGGGDVGAGSGGGDDRVGPSGRLEKKRERERMGVAGRRAVGLQQPQDCAMGRCCCILHGLQLLLEPLQDLRFLHFEDAASFAQAARDSLRYTPTQFHSHKPQSTLHLPFAPLGAGSVPVSAAIGQRPSSHRCPAPVHSAYAPALYYILYSLCPSFFDFRNTRLTIHLILKIL
jgi:hypothetical protein